MYQTLFAVCSQIKAYPSIIPTIVFLILYKKILMINNMIKFNLLVFA